MKCIEPGWQDEEEKKRDNHRGWPGPHSHKTDSIGSIEIPESYGAPRLGAVSSYMLILTFVLETLGGNWGDW